MHKKTGDLCVIAEVSIKHKKFMPLTAQNPYRPQFTTVYYQDIGYAIQNASGVVAVFPYNVDNEFEDLGEL